MRCNEMELSPPRYHRRPNHPTYAPPLPDVSLHIPFYIMLPLSEPLLDRWLDGSVCPLHAHSILSSPLAARMQLSLILCYFLNIAAGGILDAQPTTNGATETGNQSSGLADLLRLGNEGRKALAQGSPLSLS